MSGVVMLIGRDPVSNIMYHALAQSFTIDAVIREEKPSLTTFLKRRINKLGLRVVIGQLLFSGGVLPIVAFRSKRRIQRIISENGLNTSEISTDAVIEVPSVNSERTIAELRRLRPCVVVVNGTRIIQEKVLQAIAAVFLNTHAGITPMYRGVHGGYWALACGDAGNCGVTIHRVDKGIDTGSIVAQTSIGPTAQDTFATYPLLQIASAIPLLRRAVTDALAGHISVLAPRSSRSELWTHPTAWQYLKNRIELGVR